MSNPKVTDNDIGTITVTYEGTVLVEYDYENDAERRTYMKLARELVEGWCLCMEHMQWFIKDQPPERDPDLARDQRIDDALWDKQNG